jgi:KDO2-lipid IV(A) lauroyltransferase
VKDAPVRHRLELLPYLATKRLILSLSHERVRRSGAALGRLAHRVDRSHRQVALDNLAMVMPELDEEARSDTVRACFEHFGAAFCEVLSAPRFDRDSILERFDVEGEGHLQGAIELGRGVLVVCGHYGAVQVAMYPIGIRFDGVHIVARPPDNPHIAADVKRARERFGNRQVDRGGGAHRALNLIRRKAVVGFLVDQRPPAGSGIVVPFMGHPARSSPVPAFISIHSGCPAVPMTCWPIADGRYRLRFGPPILPEGKGPEAVEALTTRYMETVAADIRDQPHLWLWMHRRWKID